MGGPRQKLLPWVFAGPALIIVFLFLVYPTLQTFWYGFHRGSILNPLSRFVGLDNYIQLFTRDRFFLNVDLAEFQMSGTLVNTAVWLILFPTLTVGLGMFIAVLGDKVRYEAIVKSIVFLPMVISATAASVIFRFIYSPDPEIGAINAALSAILPNYDPVPWLGRTDLVNLAVIGAGVWIWTGLSMVVLSASYKSLSQEILDAARVDGANAWQRFWRVSVPMMARPIGFVATTMVINALKLVDLVLVMTQGGPRGASRIIGFTVYWEMFNNNKAGYGSAIAIVLFILVIPFMILQVRRVREEERLS